MDKNKKKLLRAKYEELEFEKSLASSIEISDANQLIEFAQSTNGDILRFIEEMKSKYPEDIYLSFTKALSKLLIHASELEILAESSISLQKSK